MILSQKQKKNILQQHLKHISCIANKEYQERVWIRGEGPEVDDFDDTVCDFMTVSNSILESHKNFGISKDQYLILKKLRDKFEEFNDSDHPYLPEDFIDTAEWEQVMNLAKEVLKAFDYPKK